MVYVGVDLGKRLDPAAVAAVNKKAFMRAYQAPIYPTLDVLWLERLPLGTPYPDVVARVREVVLHITGYMREKCCVVVDGTGVGAPVVNLLRAAKLGCEICAMTITSGEHASQGSSSHSVGPNWNVPKQDLMAGLQVLLEAGELRIARKLKDAGALVRELLDVRATAKRNGRMRLDGDGCGQHDDLVIAVALACWRAKRPSGGLVQGRLPGVHG